MVVSVSINTNFNNRFNDFSISVKNDFPKIKKNDTKISAISRYEISRPVYLKKEECKTQITPYKPNCFPIIKSATSANRFSPVHHLAKKTSNNSANLNQPILNNRTTPSLKESVESIPLNSIEMQLDQDVGNHPYTQKPPYIPPLNLKSLARVKNESIEKTKKDVLIANNPFGDLRFQTMTEESFVYYKERMSLFDSDSAIVRLAVGGFNLLGISWGCCLEDAESIYKDNYPGKEYLDEVFLLSYIKLISQFKTIHHAEMMFWDIFFNVKLDKLYKTICLCQRNGEDAYGGLYLPDYGFKKTVIQHEQGNLIFWRMSVLPNKTSSVKKNF
jgi:hypothetical protein